MCEKGKSFLKPAGQLMVPKISRRAMIRGVVATSAMGVATSDLVAEDRQPVASFRTAEELSPRDALKKLYDGNLRFANGQSLSANRDLNRVREIAGQQKPFAAFLGCADSRVPIEFVFDQGFGDLFVTRIAGNIASSENVGSLEFGTQVLGARVIYVLGHTECGAVSATMRGDEVPGQISGLFQYIRPAVKEANGDLDKAIIGNVRNQALLLAEASPVISKMIQRKELVVAGGIYALTTGKVTPVDIMI